MTDQHQEQPLSKLPVIGNLIRIAESLQALVVIIFGSVARGSSDVRSDLDILVVLKDEDARQTFYQQIQQEDVDQRPLVITTEQLLSEIAERPSFVSHLLDEGITVHSNPAWPDLRHQLEVKVTDPEALDREIQHRAKHLTPLAATERFRNSPVTALSHVYGISRSLVIARLLQLGIHEYDWRRAFDLYAKERPDLAEEIKALKALRPYYEYARARTDVRPDEPVTVEKVRDLVSAAGHLAE